MSSNLGKKLIDKFPTFNLKPIKEANNENDNQAIDIKLKEIPQAFSKVSDNVQVKNEISLNRTPELKNELLIKNEKIVKDRASIFQEEIKYNHCDQMTSILGLKNLQNICQEKSRIIKLITRMNQSGYALSKNLDTK